MMRRPQWLDKRLRGTEGSLTNLILDVIFFLSVLWVIPGLLFIAMAH